MRSPAGPRTGSGRRAEAGRDPGTHPFQQARDLHHAAAQDHAHRGQHQRVRGDRRPQVVGLQIPHLVAPRQVRARTPPALLDGRPGRQPFEAVAMERAPAWIGIARRVPRHGHVPHFRVHQPVQQPAPGHPAAADARADGQVYEGVQAPGRPPAVLAQGRAVHVGVESHGDRPVRARQAGPQEAGDVGAAPAGLRGVRDMSEPRRRRVRVHGSEARDAQRRQGTVPAPPSSITSEFGRALTVFSRSAPAGRERLMAYTNRWSLVRVKRTPAPSFQSSTGRSRVP